MTAQAKAAERLRSVARGDLSRLGILSDMYTGVREASGLDQETYELVQIAALVAVDGSAVSVAPAPRCSRGQRARPRQGSRHAGRDRTDRRHAACRLRRRQDRAGGRPPRRRRRSQLGLRTGDGLGTGDAEPGEHLVGHLRRDELPADRFEARRQQIPVDVAEEREEQRLAGRELAADCRISLFEIPLSSAENPIPLRRRRVPRRRGSPPPARAESRSSRRRPRPRPPRARGSAVARPARRRA